MKTILFYALLCSTLTLFGGVAKQPVIVDTDVGYDDLMAIMSLVNKRTVDVKAITISGTGLAHPKKGLETTRLLLASLDKNIPTAFGNDEPFDGGHLFPEDWRLNVDSIAERMRTFLHGTIDLISTCHARDLLAKTLEFSSEKITILSLAPLTNLAELFLKDPHLRQKVDKIYVMGGAFNVPGNLSIIKDSVAEWNFFADPIAAKAVIQTGIPIYLIPLDVTNAVPLTLSLYEKVKKTHGETQRGKLFLSLLEAVVPWIAQDGFYFWDVVAAEILADPSLAHFESCKMDIVTESGPNSGRTFFAENGFPVHIAKKVDASKLLQRFYDTVK